MSKDPTITALIVTGRLRAHYTYPNGDQMMEEYDQQSNQILMRRTMKKSTLGGKGKWQYEIGEPSSTFQPDTDLLKPSQSKNPIFIRKDSKKNFEWRIRNLPYPKDTYTIQIDHAKQQIVIKTTVKKYYKRFGIAALQNLGIKLEEQNIKWKYANNTLIIQYKKPQQIIFQQQATITKLRQIAAHGTGDFGASNTSASSEGGEQNKCAAQ